MKRSESDRLVVYYAGLTDKDLQEAYRAGPGGYRGDVWGIVESEHARRFGAADPALPQVAPERGPAVPDQDRANRTSPWFLFARLRGVHWPAGFALPTTYLRFLGGMAGVWTLVNLIALVTGVVDYLSYHLYEGGRHLPLLEAANVGWSISIFVAASSRRPWAWHYLMWALLLGSFYKALAALIWYPLMWLYLARRRAEFGLSPWRSVM